MSVEQTSMNQLITDNIDIWTSTVKTKSASGRGSSKKRELYGVKKLRELILELAVRGKLVPQDPTDEHASVLLERIAEEKAQLVKDKKIKKPKKLEDINYEDQFIELPQSWAIARLGNLCTKLTDGSHNPAKDFGSGYPMFSSQNVHFRSIDFTSPSRYVDEDNYLKEHARTQIEPRDVLLTIVGTLGRAAVVPNDAPEFVLQRSVAVLQTKIDSDFLTYFLASPTCIKYFEENGKGTAQKGIYLGKLSLMPVFVPSLEEQHRIVAKVDELMTLCDQLEQQTEASIAAHQVLVTTLLGTLTNSANAEELMQNWQLVAEHFDTLFTTEESIDQLKQTILQLAVMGKLVPQDQNDEPASKLLERIAEEKAQLIKEKKIKKQKALPPIADDEKPFELPSGWEWCRLGDLCKLVTSGSRGWKEYYASSGATFIRSQDIKYDRLDFDERAYVQLPKSTEGKRTKVDVGNLLMTITGANVGKVAVVEDPIEEAYVSQHVALIKLIDDVLIDYLHVWLTGSMGGRGLLLQSSYGAKPGLNLQNINELLIPLPTMLELNRVVLKVREMLAISEQLKDYIKSYQTTQLYLTEAIVEQAI
ncbi:restriction modification system DNA specificity domain [Vibrio mediterranei AK1]|uniref:restriction endonuclease subunit S n=1 Tax=Vibrio mediterranei TaxID=689 RepID=UPI000154120C|nr:restriction endonuclease subunit S [Vibrio mediterranei]EDL53731.1 restriction modification system DNA specificity domain [Vibrio mediterranei AK1]